ncbi:MAG: hypothetical protein ACXW31_13445 [Thermoanaerobaculia bacterium]
MSDAYRPKPFAGAFVRPRANRRVGGAEGDRGMSISSDEAHAKLTSHLIGHSYDSALVREVVRSAARRQPE